MLSGSPLNAEKGKERKENAVKKSACFICKREGELESGYEGLEFEGASYDIRFCPSCGLGVTVPFLSPERLKKIYSSTYREDDSTRFPGPLEAILYARSLQARMTGKHWFHFDPPFHL